LGGGEEEESEQPGYPVRTKLPKVPYLKEGEGQLMTGLLPFGLPHSRIAWLEDNVSLRNPSLTYEPAERAGNFYPVKGHGFLLVMKSKLLIFTRANYCDDH
jgi:hypothetical protein